ncbi:hypothetical protein [Pseudosulfitobacter sp. SM2401]|uniref:hypothetical protein n=1 Tax=Pseudosulfitobacter sp. SM2401 TaxID=3350098 RepID=UPI0036F1F817
MKRNQEELDRRWDVHTERQIAISKSGVLAVTVLNSGSWLALLSQTGKLQDFAIGWVLGSWGAGALLATLIWIVMFLNSHAQMQHDFDRENKSHVRKLDKNLVCGVVLAAASLFSFGVGVVMLALAFS